MTAITEPLDTGTQSERPELDRTFAMTVVGAGCWVMVAGVAVLPGLPDLRVRAGIRAVQMVPNLTPIFISVGAIFGVIGTLRWSGRGRDVAPGSG